MPRAPTKYSPVEVRFAFADDRDVRGAGILIAPGLAVVREPYGRGYQIIHLPTGMMLLGCTVKHQRTAIAAARRLAESKVCWPRIRKASQRTRERARPQWDGAREIMVEDSC